MTIFPQPYLSEQIIWHQIDPVSLLSDSSSGAHHVPASLNNSMHFHVCLLFLIVFSSSEITNKLLYSVFTVHLSFPWYFQLYTVNFFILLPIVLYKYICIYISHLHTFLIGFYLYFTFVGFVYSVPYGKLLKSIGLFYNLYENVYRNVVGA